MKILIFIGTGSFFGGILRYLISDNVQSKYLTAFPLGTMFVNILGCFLIGLVFGLSDRFNFSQEVRLFIATGFLGGFTTFSAFSNETVNLLRTGQLEYAFLNIGLSVFFGLIATFLGISITKLI